MEMVRVNVAEIVAAGKAKEYTLPKSIKRWIQKTEPIVVEMLDGKLVWVGAILKAMQAYGVIKGTTPEVIEKYLKIEGKVKNSRKLTEDGLKAVMKLFAKDDPKMWNSKLGPIGKQVHVKKLRFHGLMK